MKNDFVKLVENTLANQNDINVILKTFQTEMFRIADSFVLNEAVDVVGQTVDAAIKQVEILKEKLQKIVDTIPDDDKKEQSEKQFLIKAKNTMRPIQNKYKQIFDQQTKKEPKPANLQLLGAFNTSMQSAANANTISDFMGALPKRKD